MTTEQHALTPGVTTESVRVLLQFGCGLPWNPLGCVTISGVQSDPVAITQFVCTDAFGRRVRTLVENAADLTAFTMTNIAVNKAVRKLLAKLDARVRNKCYPNVLFLFKDCPDPTRVDSPYHYDDGIMLLSIRPASGRQHGNDQIVNRSDAKSITQYIEQRTWLPIAINRFVTNEYSLRGTVDGLVLGDPPTTGGDNVDSIAVLDVGTCVGGCTKCGGAGCTRILVHTEITFQFSDESGVAGSWVTVGPGSVLGHANAYDGKLFRVETSNDDIFVSRDGGTWTAATFDVALDAPTNIVRFGLNDFGVAGSNGQFWRALGDGGNWVQVKPAALTDPDWLRICYEATITERLWLIGTNAAGTDTVVGYSDNKGKAITVIPDTFPLDAYAQVFCAQHTTFFVIDHNLYQTVCDAVGSVTSVVQKVVVGADGFITGIGNCDENDCNRLWMTTENAGEAGIWFTIDGGATWSQETLPTALSLTPSPNINPIGCCTTTYGTNPLFGFGQDIVQINGLDTE